MGSQAPSVSTLSDVFRLIEQVYSLAGDGTPLLVGSEHLDNLGPGSAPRIVFLPDEDGQYDAALKFNAGYVASWKHECGVVVLGVDPGDAEGRFEPAYALADRLVAALKALDPAHLKIGAARPKDASALKAQGPGRAVRFSFVYERNIPVDRPILRAAKQLTAISPPDPARPQGSTGNTFTLDATVTPTAERN